MKNPARFVASGLLALTLHASAQRGMHMPDPFDSLTPAEQRTLQEQANQFFAAVRPAVAPAAKSTVVISYRGQRLAFGTAISADGKILTKWSEIAPASHRLVVVTPDGRKHAAIVTGVYKEHDLAIVKCDATLTPVTWDAGNRPALGEFIALANPSGEAEGLGVVSVKSRSLRERDKAYLGVMMDFAAADKDGVPLKQVVPESAADKAGLKDGDIILSIDETDIEGAMEMRNILQRLVPGSEILVRYRRGGAEGDAKVVLGSRADTPGIRRVPQSRMRKMQRMGAVPSKVRENFPRVIQSDMAIEPNDTGAPAVDLDGKVIGIAIARGSRIKTFIVPSKTVLEVLATKPTPYSADLVFELEQQYRDIAQAQRHPRGRRSGPNSARSAESPEDRVRRHLDEIERNNKAIQDSLRKIEDALRDSDRGGR